MNTEATKINKNDEVGSNKTNRFLVISLAAAMFGGLTACERTNSAPSTAAKSAEKAKSFPDYEDLGQGVFIVGKHSRQPASVNVLGEVLSYKEGAELRFAQSLANWKKDHPNLEIISRTLINPEILAFGMLLETREISAER